MALTDNKLTIPNDFAGYEVSSLEDRPALSASALKQRFDASMESVMAPAFNASIHDLVATTDGGSGADQIGCTAVGTGTAETVQGALEELDTSIGEKLTYMQNAWIPSAVQPVYVSATQATILGDHTDKLRKSDKIRFKQGGDYKQNYICADPSYSSGTGLTTITITAGYITTGGDSSFANDSITDFEYSHGNPVGFVNWMKWTPALTSGNSDLNGYSLAIFRISENTLFYKFEASAASMSGTAGSSKASLPVTAVYGTRTLDFLLQISSTITTSSANVASGTSVLEMFKTVNIGNWAANETSVYIWINGSYTI